MKSFKSVYKFILALIALTTIVFVVLYFFDGKNSSYLTISIIFALIISVLQIVEIIFNKLYMKKRKDKTQHKE